MSSSEENLEEFDCLDDSPANDCSVRRLNGDATLQIEKKDQQATGQKSAENLSNDNNEKSNMTKQPATSDTSTTDQSNVFRLNWNAREKLINLLNKYTYFLFSKKISAEAKNVLMKANADLYQSLISLPLKSSAVSSDQVPHANEVVALSLDCETRSLIIFALAKNQSLLSVDSSSAEMISKAIEENNALVLQLMKLPVSVIAVSPATGKRMNSSRFSTAISYSLILNLQLTSFRLQTDKTPLHTDPQPKVDITSKVDRPNKRPEAGSSENTRKIVKPNCECLDFEVELDDVDELLSSSSMRRKSMEFTFNGFAWSIAFTVTKDDGKTTFRQYGSKHLLLTLYASDHDLSFKDWSIDLTYSFRVLNLCKVNGTPYVSQIRNDQVYSEKPRGFVLSYYSADKLRKGGFIKDNKIKIRFELRTRKLTRTVYCDNSLTAWEL